MPPLYQSQRNNVQLMRGQDNVVRSHWTHHPKMTHYHHPMLSPSKTLADGPCLIRCDISLASQPAKSNIPHQYITNTPMQTAAITPKNNPSNLNHFLPDLSGLNMSNVGQYQSQSLPSTPLRSVHDSVQLVPMRTASNSMSMTPQHGMLLSPNRSQMNRISPLHLHSQSIPTSPDHPLHRQLVSGVPTPSLSGGHFKQICPVNFHSNTLLTFIMSEINTVDDILTVLSHRGIHIVRDCSFWIHTKPAIIAHPQHSHHSQHSQSHRHNESASNSLHFDFESTHNAASMHSIELQSARNSTLGSYIDCNSTGSAAPYSLEILFERHHWRTNLEVAIENENISKISSIIKNLKLPFWTFEQAAETVGYFGTPSNHYTNHIKGYMIQSIEGALRSDKVLCLHAVFQAASVVKELQNAQCLINRSRTVNCLCYYFSKSLRYQSRKCIKLMLYIWISYIGDSLEESGIFERYIKTILKQLYYRKFKIKKMASMSRDVLSDSTDRSDSKFNDTMAFITWLTSVIEPSLLCDDVFTSFHDDDLDYAFSIGRKRRYDQIRSAAIKMFSADIAGIVLDFDGYGNGKCNEILV